MFIIVSADLDKVGSKAIGLYKAGSDMRPERFQRAVTRAILKMSWKRPILQQLLNILDKLYEIGVEIRLIEIPQWEKFDFITCLRTLETSIGDVFML